MKPKIGFLFQIYVYNVCICICCAALLPHLTWLVGVGWREMDLGYKLRAICRHIRHISHTHTQAHTHTHMHAHAQNAQHARGERCRCLPHALPPHPTCKCTHAHYAASLLLWRAGHLAPRPHPGSSSTRLPMQCSAWQLAAADDRPRAYARRMPRPPGSANEEMLQLQQTASCCSCLVVSATTFALSPA
jgi:hypothetical protein